MKRKIGLYFISVFVLKFSFQEKKKGGWYSSSCRFFGGLYTVWLRPLSLRVDYIGGLDTPLERLRDFNGRG